MKKVAFSKKEADFLALNEVCRVATCRNDTSHVVPVSYVFDKGRFYFATDYSTRKLENIKANGKLALTVDVYNSISNKAVCVQARARIIEKGEEFNELYRVFHRKFEWVRRDPWNAGEAPFVEAIPFNKVSWGIG